MKMLRSIILALFITVSFALHAQQFEGTITMTTTNAANGENAQVEWLVKDGNHKFIINGSADGKSVNYALLFLNGNPNGYLVSNIGGEQTLITIPASSFEVQAQNLSGATVIQGEATSINGFKATKVELKSGSGSTTVWVSNDINLSADQLPAVMNKGSLLSVLKANGITGTPVKIEARDSEGNMSYTQTIKSVSKGTVAKSEFSIDGLADGVEALKNSVQAE